MPTSDDNRNRFRGGRPEAAQPRRARVTVRFTTDEYHDIATRADGAPVADFIRRAALGQKPKPRIEIPELNREAWLSLARTTANLNQLSRAANAGFIVPAGEILPVLDRLGAEVQQLRRPLLGLPE